MECNTRKQRKRGGWQGKGGRPIGATRLEIYLAHHVVARGAEPGEGGGEAEAARPGLPPGARRRGGGAGGDDGGAVRVHERGALEEADGRERRVVGGAQHGAFHRRASSGEGLTVWGGRDALAGGDR